MTSSFGQMFWNLIAWLFQYLPWLVIALAAVMAWLKNKKSMPLMVEAAGAIAIFGLSVIRWLVFMLIQGSRADYDVYRTATIIFTFLYVAALLIFAAGFCWEKFNQWRGGSAG